mmetsp:Transcript_41152/g.60408  ORF Transcript_41152/g.60408 Transcript_41152/m.60408 type:complete len:131 (+) Transcript_41152:3-395(+)
MVSLAEALATNPAVEVLVLYRNQIGDTGMSALAKAIPKNTNLRMVNVRHNKITEVGFHVLADAVAIAEGQLHHMELGQNPGSTTSQAYRDLIRMLRHTHEAAVSETAHGYLANEHASKLDDHDDHNRIAN